MSPVFDVAARLLLVGVRDSAESERREVVLFEKKPEGIVRNLRELGIEVLICGAISQGLQRALHHAGIRVVAGICGEIDLVLAAYQSGRLQSPEFIMPGCCGRRWTLESHKRTASRARRAPERTLKNETDECS